MHTIRGGWSGRPLALAKNNESEGRKTRIRRSKEERKAMVEVFIKKYQESNNGSFPSLNLTHKEVGGSFYTVREIVRDIIQENRVLGPGKLLLEEHSFDHSLEENPLHSIAIEPQSHLTLSSKEVDFPDKYDQFINEEQILVSDEQCTSTNIQIPHNGPIINGSLVDLSDRDSDERIDTKLPVNEHKEIEEVVKVTSLAADVLDEQCTSTNIQVSHNGPIINGSLVHASDKDCDEHIETELPVNERKEIEEVVQVTSLAADVLVEQCTSTNVQVSQDGPIINGSLVDVRDKDSDEHIETELPVNEHKEIEEVVKVTPLAADVIVEKFPMSPISRTANNSDERSKASTTTSDSEKQVSQTIELDSGVGLFIIEGNNSAKTSEHVVEKAGENFASSLSEAKSDLMEVAPIVESSNGSTLKEGGVHEVEGPQLEQGQKTSEKPPNGSPSGAQNQNKTFSDGLDQASKVKEETQIENKADAHQGGGSQPQKQTIPPLNRINLDSWEGMSRNPSKPETNPLLEILKAFVSAFVKFWSE